MNAIEIKNKILYIGSMFIILAAILMVAVAAYMALVSVRVVTPNVQPYTVITKEVTVGDTFIYEVDSCKYIGVPATVVRRFVDEKGTRYPQPPETSNIKTGCDKIRVPVAVPQLHSGTWYMDLEVSYQVNPLRMENYHFITENFVITNKE